MPHLWSLFNHHPLSENHDFLGTVGPQTSRNFSTTKHPVDLRPVCKLKFVRCGPAEKNRALYLSKFNHGSPAKFQDTLFQKAIFDKITDGF